MARCEGTTQSGARCRRSVAEGDLYCSTHADQAQEEVPGFESESPCEDRDVVDAVLALAVGGVLLASAIFFRRIFRVL